MPRILAAAVVVLSLAQFADAVVMCARPRRDGTYSTSIKLRETCRPNETLLSPAALGLQGPAGPGALVKDSVGATLGVLAVVGGVDAGPVPGNVLRHVGTATVPLTVDGAGQLYGGSRSILWFPTTDCSGPSAFIDAYTPLRPEAVKVGATLFYGNGSPQTVTIRSKRTVPPVFADACTAIPDEAMALAPTATEDLSVFVPPFHFEVR